MNGIKEIKTITAVKKLRVDALYGKRKHFNAADRKSRYHKWLGIPAILLNIFVGSILFGYLCEAIPDIFKWIGAVMAFTSALLSSLQTFFNFDKVVEGHRNVASIFLDIAKECLRIIGYYDDKIIDEIMLRQKLEELATKYSDAVAMSVTFPTIRRDYLKAVQDFNREESYTEEELKIGGV